MHHNQLTCLIDDKNSHIKHQQLVPLPLMGVLVVVPLVGVLVVAALGCVSCRKALPLVAEPRGEGK